MPSLGTALSQGEGGQPGEWIKLDSSSISSVAFDRQQSVLKIHFNDGDTWAYKDVPMVKYRSLIHSNSSGAYLKREIMPHHEAVKLHDGAPDDLSSSGN